MITISIATPKEMSEPNTSLDADRKFILYYDWDNVKGFLVKVYWYPDGKLGNIKWHSKLFAFRDFESEASALIAAKIYRDDWVADSKARNLFTKSGNRFNLTLQSNNTSGILGINRTERTGKSGKLEANWQTTFPGVERKTINRKFSISKYGEVGALRLAIEARRQGVLAALSKDSPTDDDENFAIVALYDDILANLADLKDQSQEYPLIEIVKNTELSATTKFDLIKIRIGQQRFRREVLQYYGFTCAITGSSLLIRASHIKPWRAASNEERVDPANGLALSPVYDAAFDVGLISFRSDGKIMVADALSESASALGITGEETLSKLANEHHSYLDWHRKNMFLSACG